MRIISNLSPNYSKNIRKVSQIKFVIIHYTGMQSEIDSIKRLKNPRFKVSSHYLINRKGTVIQMVREKHTAWHAGKSRWKNFTNLNRLSIGIELENRGHRFGYQNFTKNQLNSLLGLCKSLKKKYSIKQENFLGHSDIAPLRKQDPGEKFPWKKMSECKIGKWYKEKPIEIVSDKKKIDKVFFRNLKKLGYRYFNIHKRSYLDLKVIKSFQQHYLPKNVSGKIDEKTFKICHFLTN